MTARFGICFIDVATRQKASRKCRNLCHLSTLVSIRLTRHVVHRYLSVRKPAFNQGFRDRTNVDTTLAPKVPVHISSHDSRTGRLAAARIATHIEVRRSHYATNGNYGYRSCHSLSSWRRGPGRSLRDQSARHRLFHEGCERQRNFADQHRHRRVPSGIPL